MREKPSSEAAGVPTAAGAPLPQWRRFRFPQSLYRPAAFAGMLAFLAWSLEYLNIDLGRLWGVAGRIVDVLSTRYYPPDVGHVLRPEYIKAVVETLQMSWVASIAGMAIAIPFAWVGAANVTPLPRIGYPVARLFVMGCRSVHEMVWTILMVTIVGFGMLPGTLALTLFCVGFSGKLFAEAIESIDQGQVEAIRTSGASHLQVFLFAVLPQVRVAWAGIGIYTWDVVFRAATVVGFFGAGGMGWYLRESVQSVESRQVAAILLSIIVVVIAAELFSAWARDRIARAIA
jgi:phosphonate transport system permease protein